MSGRFMVVTPVLIIEINWGLFESAECRVQSAVEDEILTDFF